MSAAPVRSPNIVWIIADQHRAQSLGWNGDPNLSTPAIDNLARNGVVFSRAVAGAPWCTPFRSALLTGTYPHRNGCVRTPSRLDPAIPTIAHAFNENGYHTAWVGKWHLSGSNSADHLVPPDERGGFAWWMGYENNNKQNDVSVHGTGCETPRRLDRYETRGLADIFLGHLREHLQRTRSAKPDHTGDGYQPFFGVLSVQPPHSPYVPPDDVAVRAPADIRLRANVPPVDRIVRRARRDIAGYSAMVEEIDRTVARVRDELRRLGVDRETYVIYFSDHGDMLGSHGQWEKSAPWEESVRIPMVIGTVGGQEQIQVGERNSPLNHVDIAPTTLGLCGIPTPVGMVGYDFSHTIVHPRRRLAYHDRSARRTPPESALLQQIPRKFHPHSVNRAWRAIVSRDNWKYVCTPGNDWMLFDLDTDPYELANLCYDSVYQDRKEALHAELARLISETGDDFPLPDIALEER